MTAYKNLYDPTLQFSRITKENWLDPDRKDYVPFDVTQDEWVEPFLAARLESNVPTGILQVFEVARGAMIYSWFFYPLATLGFEQCARIAEFAAREACRCRSLQPDREDFYNYIKELVKAGVLSQVNESRWQAQRHLRNNRSHIQNLMLIDPVQAKNCLETTAELINDLFRSSVQS